MKTVTILCVEDEPEVRDAIARDMEMFGRHFRIECAEDVEDARQIMKECADEGSPVGLILCDHVLPGENGVEFLVELNQDASTEPIRKVLLTGQAGLDATIKAVNEANLHHYIAKPWTAEELQQVAKEQLTEYVLTEEENLLPYVEILDGPRLLDAVSHRRSDR